MPSTRHLIASAAILAQVIAGCATKQPVQPPRVQAIAPTAQIPLPEKRPTRDEAIERGSLLMDGWEAGPQYDAKKRPEWLSSHGADEATIRGLLTAIVEPCLAERDPARPCEDAKNDTFVAKVVGVLEDILAEVADPSAPGGASVRLLIRLEARELWRSGSAVERVLERRTEEVLSNSEGCSPPTNDELSAARLGLADFATVDPGPTPKAIVARWPTSAELDDLAYFYASIAASGAEVGVDHEDHTAQSLPEGHSAHGVRRGLRDAARDALRDGQLEAHLKATEAYLRTLGFPGPLRTAEEGDMRWGGAGASYAMRDAARSAELIGHYDTAEALYRRATPGGGACGTTTPTRRDHQIEGALRAAERLRGCRGAVVERLFAVDLDLHGSYGPERLAKAGFNVPRLYAGALLTLGRTDLAALERALRGLPSRPEAAVSRLGRLGGESWASRVRAIPGYADTARASALDPLLRLGERGPTEVRVEALDAIGRLVEERGYDPCLKTSFGIGWGRGSSRHERPVQNVMGSCETRVPVKPRDAAANRISAMAGDADPKIRESVATTLGRLARPSARGALTLLERDPFDGGGKVCTSQASEPEVCVPNKPVARAAREALAALARAEEMRKKQRLALQSK